MVSSLNIVKSVLPPRIRQRWSGPSPRPPRCPVTFSASWCNAPSRNGRSRTSGRTSLSAFRPPASGRSQAPACSGRGQPSARQLRTAACESVPNRCSHRCRAASFLQTSVSWACTSVLKKGLPCADPM